jgi:hypothetical protein
VALPARTHRQLYRGLGELQDRLGVICDLRVSVARFEAWLKEARGDDRRPIAAQLSRQRRQLATSKTRYFRWQSAQRRKATAQAWRKALD